MITKREKLIFVFVIIAVVSAWLFFPSFLTRCYDDILEKGAYGDTYGTVNALFTALAFVGVIATIYLQRKELILQRRVLELTRDELEGQREQLQIQSGTFKQQRFESTFFQLISIHSDNVSSLFILDDADRAKTKQTGRACLLLQRDELSRYISELSKENTDIENAINSAFDKLFENTRRSHLGHYFRQLYHIVKFVDDSEEIEDEYKQRYADFVQAQLNNDELILLAYNGLSKHGNNFRSLIEKYGLLENLTDGTLFAEDHASMYERAFGKKDYRHIQ